MSSTAIQRQSALDGLDEITRQLERKWGVDRLRLLVDDELRVRFDQQRANLDGAIDVDDDQAVVVHALSLIRGWRALDAAATAAGAEPLAPEIWEMRLEGGDVVALVRTEAEAHQLAYERREVWTLAEVATLIDKLGADTRRIKNLFPGATVAEIRKRQEPPPIDWAVGDPIDDLFQPAAAAAERTTLLNVAYDALHPEIRPTQDGGQGRAKQNHPPVKKTAENRQI